MKENNQDFMASLMLLTKGACLGIAGMILPIFFLFFPAPFIVESVKKGILKSMGVFLVVCLIIGWIYGVSQGFFVLTTFGPFILAFDYCIKTKKGIGVTLLVGTMLFLFSLGFNLYMSQGLEFLQSKDAFSQMIQAEKEIFTQAGIPEVEMERMVQQVKETTNMMLMLLPSIFLLVSLAVSYITYSMVGKRLFFQGVRILSPPPFVFIRLPRNMVATMLIVFFLAALAANLLNFNVEIFIYNLTFVAMGLLLFQGLSVASFFLHRFVPMSIFRGLFLGILIIVPFFQMGIVMIGLLDQWMNFRRIQG